MKTAFTKEELQNFIQKKSGNPRKAIRILFVPRLVTDMNMEQVLEIYGELSGSNYETAVILEPVKGNLDKKIPMASATAFKTQFGRVAANEKLRDEFCDEEDDFFIDDSGLHGQMSLYDHLAMLQCARENFNAVSMQLADERPEIVDEMVYVLRELLAEKNVVLICACDLHADHQIEFSRIRDVIDNKDISGLQNFLYSGKSKIEGAGVFLVGVRVALAWELEIEFPKGRYHSDRENSLIAGYAAFRSGQKLGSYDI
ncbi:MAG: AmmeMemoRadiSam system protein B [Balneolales bacterium]